ncbi:MAG: four helix bundle protein [Candidatus Moraniibacteriota bacterium]
MNTPPAVLPLLQRLKTVYQLWHSTVAHIPKLHRYTFGGRMDKLFLDTLEILFRAQYAKPEQKLQYLIAGSGKIDLLKFFLQIGWENKLIDTKKYTALSTELEEAGRMLGGWKRGLETKLSPKK